MVIASELKKGTHHARVPDPRLFLRAEGRFPHSATPHIAELGLDHSTQFRGARLRFQFEDSVTVSVDAAC